MNFFKYDDWQENVPKAITDDSLWKMKVYKLSLFLADISWSDISTLFKDGRTKSISSQLYRAIGSIGSNISEGYSMGTGKNRARYYEYVLGSTREARDWYYKSRHILGNEIIEHRFLILTEIIKLLLTMVPDQRNYSVNEPSEDYDSGIDDAPILTNED